jgi:hypothetical protein
MMEAGMNTTPVKRFKWFWACQDVEEEAWLGEMSKQGLHLKSPGCFHRYTFQAGAPREAVYRLDFLKRSEKTEDYFQLIRDAGWEHLGEMNGWQYWRKAVQDGGTPEIFTDIESKIQKYQRLTASFSTSAGFLLVIGLAVFKRFPGRHPLWFVILYIALFFSWLLFAALNTIKVQMRINELKRSRQP